MRTINFSQSQLRFSREMLTKLLVVLLSLGLYLSVASAEVDCSKRPERVNPKTCCPLPDFISDELKEKCKKFNNTMSPPLPPPPPPPPMSDEMDSESNSTAEGRPRHHHHHHHHHRHHFPSPCLMSCVFNETGIYVDHKLDEEKLKSYLQKVFANSTDLQDVTAESFATCAAKSAEFKEKMRDSPAPPPPPAGAPACPFDASFLMGCVFRQTFKNCPDSIWNNTDQCNHMREYFENCKPPRGPPPPPEQM